MYLFCIENSGRYKKDIDKETDRRMDAECDQRTPHYYKELIEIVWKIYKIYKEELFNIISKDSKVINIFA